MMQWSSIFGVVLVFSRVFLSDGAIDKHEDKRVSLNIAVVGAGPAGIVTAKHCVDGGHNVTVYEQNKELGGVWVYTDEIGKNQYGLNIHTAMYKGLRTNAPLPIMEFPGHHYPNDTLSFPPQSDVLKYLHSFADRIDLEKHIKFEHFVVHINPTENEKWEIIIKDLPNNKFITQIYDAVFICNGHFSVPFIPKIRGAKEFRGKLLHSHHFRDAETFQGENVLIIGDGPSGQDLIIHLSSVAKSITLSRKNWLNATKEAQEKYHKKFPPTLFVKDIVKRLTAGGVEFIDGTRDIFSAVIFATGYKFSYSFLSVESGIHVDDSFIQPLYKHVINIEHPTMALIGIPRSALNFAMFDLQARFALNYLTNEKSLPSKDEMLNDQKIEAEKLWNLGFPKRRTHSVYPMQKQYFDDLSSLAHTDSVPGILVTLALDGIKKRSENPSGFRDYKFTVVDDKTYTRIKYKE